MICATRPRFHIAHDCVQPLEDWRLLWPAPHDFGDVLAARVGCGSEAGQAIRKDNASRYNPLLCPALDGFACKSTNSMYLDVKRPTFVVQIYGGDKRKLVCRSATSPAATELSAEVGVVDADPCDSASVIAGYGWIP
jgi:hypothetical protein